MTFLSLLLPAAPSAGPPPIATAPGVKGNALKGGSIVEETLKTDPAQFTILAWIRLDRYPSGSDARRWIVCRAAHEQTAGNISLFVDGRRVSGYLNIGGGAGNMFEATGAEGQLPLNKWTPVAMTYDGDMLRVYCDGKETAAKKIGKARVPVGGALTIGARTDRFSTFDCGDIDEVSLYDRVLTAEEMGRNNAGRAGALTQGLVKHWDFETPPDRGEADKISERAGPEPQFKGLLK